MGCIQSAHYHKIYEAKPELSKWASEFESLMFTEADIGAMYYHFRRVDNDGGGTIDVAELLAFLDLEKTKFSKRIFSMFDEDESGQIDFREFVLSCWNYCSLGRSTLMLFAFDLYDKDSSGEIDGKEVCQMLKDIYGKDFDKNSYAKKILERIFIELGKEITVTEFREFVRKYPALLFPAFQLQDMLQQKIMGADFWKVFSERRMSLSGGKYIEIGEFMALHVNKGLKENVIGTIDRPDDYMPSPEDARIGKLRQQRSVTGELLGTTGTVANRRASSKRASSSKNLLSPALGGAVDGNGDNTDDSTPPAAQPPSLQRRGSNLGQVSLERKGSNLGLVPLERRGSNVGQVPLERKGSNLGQVPPERRGSMVSGGMSLIRGKSASVLPSGGVIRADIVGGGLTGSQQAAAASSLGQAIADSAANGQLRRAGTSGFFDDVQTQDTAPSSGVSFKTAASVKTAADKWKSRSKKR